MKSYLNTLVLSVVCGLLLVPAATHAATATLLTDTIVLFTIDITFSDSQFDLELPIAASSTIKHNDRVDVIGVAIETEDDERVVGAITKSLLLGRAPINDGRYQLTAGEISTFTVMALVEFDTPITSEYTMRVSKLPYWLDGRRTTMHQNQLDDLQTATLTVN